MDPKALQHITYGLYLLSARQNDRDSACIINTAAQVASDPVRISISVNKSNYTCGMILDTGVFTLSALSVDAPFALFQRFGMQSGRDCDKFAGFDGAQRSENGLYHLTRYSSMNLSAKVVQQLDLGSHILFLAEVVDAAVLSDRPACTYSYYQSEIKPKAQKAKKKQWECAICGYIYEGDPVPDDFICPLCKHGKEDFRPVQ